MTKAKKVCHKRRKMHDTASILNTQTESFSKVTMVTELTAPAMLPNLLKLSQNKSIAQNELAKSQLTPLQCCLTF